MVKEYDFLKAKQIIEDNQETLVEASMGMQEDWFWTAETVWKNREFTKDLTKIETIGGIPGSHWATPVIMLEHRDGSDEVFECFKGESNGFNPFGSMLTSGPLSSEVQANMPAAKEYKTKKNS